MNKRILSVLIILSLLLAAVSMVPVSAEPRSSDYLLDFWARVNSGSGSGELKLTYYVTTGNTGIIRIGVVALFVYRSDGTMAKVITCSTSNGLVRSGVQIASGTYTIEGLEPGQVYYCNLRFLVEDGNGSDSRPYTTNSAITPR